MPELILDNERLNQICEKATKAKVIAIDTEFISSKKSYYPKLSIIQLCCGQEIYIIDALVIQDFSQFAELLKSKTILKIFHSAQNDLRVIWQSLSIKVNNIFDTQIATLFLGHITPLSYKKAVHYYCNVELSKSETQSDWLVRPLSKIQQTYASDDVRYLWKIYEIINEKLQKVGKLSWVQEESNLFNVEQIQPDYKKIFLKITKGLCLKKMSSKQIAAIFRLIKEREAIAIIKNLQRESVLNNKKMLELSAIIAKEKFQIHDSAYYSMPPRCLDPISNDELKYAQRLLDNPFFDESITKNCLYSELKAFKDSVASQYNISPHLLATTQDLYKLIQNGKIDDKFLYGWRYDVFTKHVLFKYG